MRYGITKMFTATKTEKDILRFIDAHGPASPEQILSQTENHEPAARAIEGCLAKHFAAQDAEGRLALTQAGKKQI